VQGLSSSQSRGSVFCAIAEVFISALIVIIWHGSAPALRVTKVIGTGKLVIAHRNRLCIDLADRGLVVGIAEERAVANVPIFEVCAIFVDGAGALLDVHFIEWQQGELTGSLSTGIARTRVAVITLTAASATSIATAFHVITLGHADADSRFANSPGIASSTEATTAIATTVLATAFGVT
jgi:hypothetical protein